MNLLEAIQTVVPVCIAIVGAGGKTTALFQLARQVPGKAWVTTSTHLRIDQLDLADMTMILPESPDSNWFEILPDRKVIVFTGGYTPDERAHSPSEENLRKIHELAIKESIPLLIEADGSRSLPIKAPAEHEPAIPAWVDCVIVMAGLSALGKPFSAEWVCRPVQFSTLTDVHEGEAITIESLADVFCHPLGGLKGIPPGARRVALFNQADNQNQRRLVARVAPRLLSAGYERVIAASLRKFPDDVSVFQ